MDSTGLLHGDPIPACAQRYPHLRKSNAPPDTTICDYYVSMCTAPKSVTGTNIVDILRSTAKHIGFQRIGFSPYEIGYHSLRSGGATTLHQDHIYDSPIKIIGIWRSDAFLIYLQVQVATFTKGFSKATTAVPWFTHQVPTPSPV